MFGFLKNLLRRPAAETSATHGEDYQGTNGSAPAPVEYRPAPNVRSAPVQSNGRSIELPMARIIENLPLELQPRVRQNNPGDDVSLSVPLEKILAQLSRGVVKVSFGELRQAVPGVFSAENDRDRVMVPLPLGEILSRLNPALITRRRTQQQIVVPADIASPFDPQGGNFFAYGRPEPVQSVSTPPAPAPRATTPSPAAPRPSNRGALKAVATPEAPAALPFTPVSRVTTPQTPPPPTHAAPPQRPPEPKSATTPPAPAPIQFQRTPKPEPKPQLRLEPPTPALAPTSPEANMPAAVPPQAKFVVPGPMQHSAAMPAPASPAPAPIPAAAPRPVVPAKAAVAATPAASTKAAPAAEPVLASLSSLAESWPEGVRREIVDLNLVDAQIALPAAAVEQGLKQGRIVFSWKSIRSWLKPAIPATVSAEDDTVVELPLKAVAPLFLARQKGTATPHEKVAVDEQIPNLFFGSPQSENLPAAVSTPRASDTNYYVWGDTSDTVVVHESEVKRGSTPGTKFVAKYATPNEVISRAAGLEGVAGALIALPDGLMVANQLPPELNGDTLAAFLPQIFGKVTACTKELRMGELNNLNFTVGNVPWKIFRVNAIYFAAFGRAGEPLPTAQLAALAAELDHKQK